MGQETRFRVESVFVLGRAGSGSEFVVQPGSQVEIMRWGSMTNFCATALSKALYPAEASSNEIDFAFTAFAMLTRPARIAFINSRFRSTRQATDRPLRSGSCLRNMDGRTIFRRLTAQVLSSESGWSPSSGPLNPSIY